MTTDLGTLTTAADRWDGMAKRFKELERAYQRDVHGIALHPSWTGLSADAAQRRFSVTLKEFQNAQVEAKAVASLLRDAHTQFVDLRGKVKAAHDDAIDAGMKVSDQGVVSYNTEKLSQSDRTAVAHDPDYQESIRKSVSSWQERIDQVVKDVGDADKGVEIAFTAVVIDSEVKDGTINGFNGQALGDIEKYEADEASNTATKTNGWTADGKATASGPDAGFSATGPKYGKEGSVRAYADLGHATAEGSLANGSMKLSGIADAYAGARATANVGITDKGVAGKAEVSAGGRALAEGRAGYGHVGAYGRAEGFAGGEAQVSTGVGLEGVNAGAKAFAGAKGTVAGGAEVAGIGAGGTAEGWAGAGAEAQVTFGKGDDGKFHIGGKVGLALGLGGSVGAEFTVDPGKVADAAGDAADAVGDTVDAVGDATGSVKDTVTSWF
ncbi:hypothetical protein ACIHCQ_27110 [Streptomyces sp. NPDC052236]|uniref:hypothetical protein n=1 Tax=Streptomyces sp. NPDC052236 TaxID=3365686 RepID=UPI0037CEF427